MNRAAKQKMQIFKILAMTPMFWRQILINLKLKNKKYFRKSKFLKDNTNIKSI